MYYYFTQEICRAGVVMYDKYVTAPVFTLIEYRRGAFYVILTKPHMVTNILCK